MTLQEESHESCPRSSDTNSAVCAHASAPTLLLPLPQVLSPLRLGLHIETATSTKSFATQLLHAAARLLAVPQRLYLMHGSLLCFDFSRLAGKPSAQSPEVFMKLVFDGTLCQRLNLLLHVTCMRCCVMLCTVMKNAIAR